MPEDTDASSRFLWPPTIYGLAAGLASVLAWLEPLPFLPGPFAGMLRLLGYVIIAAAIALLVSAEREFKRVGTPVRPTAATQQIVSSGVFRYTRNPMYLGMTIILVGAALAANSLWFLLVAPVAVIAVTKLAIEREERYLSRKFGPGYQAYKTRVRRWL
jgi:protein-S-isoprenylcysteine O-methyltransferase Ste14